MAVGEGRDPHQVVSPLTGEVLGEVPIGTFEDVTAAYLGADVQQGVGPTPGAGAAAVLLRYHDLVLDRQDELLDLIQLENGKARATPSRR